MRAGRSERGAELETVAAPRFAIADVDAFESLYEANFDFVWRSVRRLGVADHAVDDVVQEVFLVVHRRLADFEGRSSARTWLFGITLRVVRTFRRSAARKRAEPLPEEIPDAERQGPEADVERRQAREVLDRLLEELEEDKRAVFILAELEQMTAPEIAEALDVKLNTVYSRLRAARKAFEAGLARHQATARRVEGENT